jgi:hypothetical protein
MIGRGQWTSRANAPCGMPRQCMDLAPRSSLPSGKMRRFDRLAERSGLALFQLLHLVQALMKIMIPALKARCPGNYRLKGSSFSVLRYPEMAPSLTSCSFFSRFGRP